MTFSNAMVFLTSTDIPDKKRIGAQGSSAGLPST